jgi:hypothetical protein
MIGGWHWNEAESATFREKGRLPVLSDPWADTTTPHGRLIFDRLTQHQIKRRDAGETITDIGRSYNVSHSTISRL